MPNKRLLNLLYLVVIAVTSGCARVSTYSVVHADGSYKRTVTYHVTEPAPSASGDGSQTSAPGIAKFEDVASLPKGPEWKTTRSMEESTSVISAARDVPAGVPVSGDLGLKVGDPSGPGGKDAPMILNKVSVTKMPDGKIEYRESLHWNGKMDDDLTKPNATVIAGIKSALPASVSGDTKAATALAVTLQGSLWEILFGSPKALFSEFLMNQDYAAYQLEHRMQPAFDKALTEQYGSRLSVSQRAAATKKLRDALIASASAKTKPNSAGDNNATIASLFYRVQMPGKITSANGEFDPDSSEVVWSMYSLGPAARDITLTATSEAR